MQADNKQTHNSDDQAKLHAQDDKRGNAAFGRAFINTLHKNDAH